MQKKETENFLKNELNETKEGMNSLKKESNLKKEKTTTKLSKLVDRIISIPIYLVVILLPIFFYQNVPSPLELNKQSLLVGLIGISVLAWVGKMAWKNEIRFRKSFLLIPILTFLLIYTLSTVFSSYYEQSMWGYFGGEGKSLVSTLFLVAFFILIYNNIKNYQGVAKLLFAFLIGGFILVIFGILQNFQIYLIPFEFAKVKFFSPVGSVYIYSIYVASVFLVSVSLFLSNVSRKSKFILVTLSILAFFLLMVINFKIVWVVLLLMLAFILGVTILIENKKPSRLRIIPMIFLVLALLFVLRAKPLFNNSDLPVEIFLKNKTAAEISLSSIKANPLLGSGPTTFANVYKKNRPSNLGDFSVVNFNESASFFLTLVSTTGILGTISFLFLIISGLGILFKEMVGMILRADQGNNFQNYLGVSIGVTWLFLTICLFLYFANITILMLWWLFFGLLVSISFLNKKNKDNATSEIAATSINPRTSFFLSFGFVLIIIGFIAILYLQSQKYIAAIYFSRALKESSRENNVNNVAEKISKAVSLDPNRDSYYQDLAVVHLALAKEKIIEKGLQNLTPEEANFVSTRFRSALESLNQSKVLNPANSDNFVSLANLYEEFIVIQKNSGEKAIENYQKAIELDPKNPEIYQSMANVQITLSDLETSEQNLNKEVGVEIEIPRKSLEYLAMAEEYLKKALEIKADYVSANVLLVIVYEKSGELEKALAKAIENTEIYPNSAELFMNLGRIYYQQESYDQAEINLRRALGLNSQYSNARYLFGLVLDKQGNKEEALKEFEKIQEFNPDNELLTEIINNLKNGRKALFGVGTDETQANLEPEINLDELETVIDNEDDTNTASDEIDGSDGSDEGDEINVSDTEEDLTSQETPETITE